MEKNIGNKENWREEVGGGKEMSLEGCRGPWMTGGVGMLESREERREGGRERRGQGDCNAPDLSLRAWNHEQLLHTHREVSP